MKPARTDAELLRAARRDADAFNELYQRYARRVYSFFARRTRNRDASFDLTAETFARVWLSRSAFRDPGHGSAAPWLFGIAQHVLAGSVEHHRLETAAREQLGIVLERATQETEPDPVWLESLNGAMASLSPTHRKAVQLRVVHGFGYEELAAGLGCSQTAARIRVSRGLAALRHALGGQL